MAELELAERQLLSRRIKSKDVLVRRLEYLKDTFDRRSRPLLRSCPVLPLVHVHTQGPHWNGRSGVHTHMTNTRITDPEIMERRYPVILTKFYLGPGTGGEGLFTGGDGVVREMLFRTPLQLSVLTDHRVYQPYGREGGQLGSLGLNTLILKNGAVKDLEGRATVQVEPGDTFRLETPGGGGCGNKKANDRVLPADTSPAKRTKAAQK